ncbi:hypothetical protein FKM82_007039 [Ascaphus truei]
MKVNDLNLDTKARKGGTLGRGVKTKCVLPTGRNPSEKVPTATSKPLTGKVFYLDLPSNVISEKLEKDIKELGGTVEGFLSKDISYLITNKKEAKFAQALKQISPIPSPDSGNSSPRPSSRRGSNEASSLKAAETSLVSRGKSLVEKAIKEQEIIPKNSILSNALNWGVKILHVEDTKYYIEQKKKQLQLITKAASSAKAVSKGPVIRKPKSGKLKRPFLKVEDSSRHYRPFYLQLTDFPSLNYPISKACCPFDVDKKVNVCQKLKETKRNKTDSERDGEIAVHLNLKEKKKRGYCECCLKKYEDLESHILSEQHKTFSESLHYQVVDDLISGFDYDFVEYSKNRNQTKRIKCSVGILMPATDNRKEEQDVDQTNEHISQTHNSHENMEATEHETKSENPLAGIAASLHKPFSYTELTISFSCPDDTSGLYKRNCTPDSTSIQPVINAVTPLENLPSNAGSRDYIEKLPIPYIDCNQSEKDACENNPEGLNVDWEPHKTCNDLHNCIPASIDNSPHQTHYVDGLSPPAKCFKILNSDLNAEVSLTRTVNDLQSEECTELMQGKMEKTSPTNETNESSVYSSECLPFGKLHRKVKTLARKNRNNKEGLCCRLTNTLSVTEGKDVVLSSPTQSLLALFETSESNSEFFGFTCCLANKPCSIGDNYQECSQGNRMWSLLAHTSSSGSSFAGF